MKPIEMHDLEVSALLARGWRITYLLKRMVIASAFIVLLGLWGIVFGRTNALTVQSMAVIGLAEAVFLAYTYRQRLLLRSDLAKRTNLIRAAKFGKKFFFNLRTGDGEDLCYKTTEIDPYCQALMYAMFELKQPGPIVFANFSLDREFGFDESNHWIAGRADLVFEIAETADPEDLLRDFPLSHESIAQKFFDKEADRFTGYFIACGVGLKPDPLEIELSQDVKVVCTVRLIAEPSSAKSAAS